MAKKKKDKYSIRVGLDTDFDNALRIMMGANQNLIKMIITNQWSQPPIKIPIGKGIKIKFSEDVGIFVRIGFAVAKEFGLSKDSDTLLWDDFEGFEPIAKIRLDGEGQSEIQVEFV